MRFSSTKDKIFVEHSGLLKTKENKVHIAEHKMNDILLAGVILHV
jgi:hypothetical protein